MTLSRQASQRLTASRSWCGPVMPRVNIVVPSASSSSAVASSLPLQFGRDLDLGDVAADGIPVLAEDLELLGQDAPAS